MWQIFDSRAERQTVTALAHLVDRSYGMFVCLVILFDVSGLAGRVHCRAAM
jgi:hypothetical protein